VKVEAEELLINFMPASYKLIVLPFVLVNVNITRPVAVGVGVGVEVDVKVGVVEGLI